MDQLLSPGTQLTTDTGELCTIKKLLGSGGQGEVYEVDVNGASYALKWYFPEQATTEQRITIEKLVSDGPPNEKFLWPLFTTTAPDSSTFGYIMPLRPKEFKGIIDMMVGKVSPNFRALCTACYQLADGYQVLHSLGRCYRDISFGNAFFNPDTGEVRICDNDNITINGSAPGGVCGTPRFMAPEIVRGEAFPSTETDRFSLAVLLFYMLMMHHPLDGRRELEIHCMDMPALRKLYGDDPLFIWDPNNNDNRPVAGEQDAPIVYWGLYPKFIRDLFTEAFTTGMVCPHKCIVETQWRRAFIRLRDSILYCGHCGSENFYDTENVKSGGEHYCWKCKNKIQLPPRLKVGSSVVMLNHDTKLYPHHLEKMSDFNFTKGMAEVVKNPKNPSIWGLKNLTSDTWTAVTSDGKNLKIEPGRSVVIALGTKINFGTMEGEIRL